MEHIKAITFITNPIVNSYKRLVPGYEAPVYIAWSAKNRTPLIRIPASSPQSTRIELRVPTVCKSLSGAGSVPGGGALMESGIRRCRRKH